MIGTDSFDESKAVGDLTNHLTMLIGIRRRKETTNEKMTGDDMILLLTTNFVTIETK